MRFALRCPRYAWSSPKFAYMWLSLGVEQDVRWFEIAVEHAAEVSVVYGLGLAWASNRTEALGSAAKRSRWLAKLPPSNSFMLKE